METKKKSRVLVADDHNIFREGLVARIHSQEFFEVVAEAGNGVEALDLIKKLNPDIAVLDISMPGMNGLEVAKKSMEKGAATNFIVLTMYKEEQFFNKAMDIGIKGYLLKENTFEDLLACLKAVSKGRAYVSPLLAGHKAARKRKVEFLRENTPSLKDLTHMERKVLKLIGEYKTSKEIAENLYISDKTVNNHRANICEKLNLKGKNKLLHFAMEYKPILQSGEYEDNF